MVAPQYVYVSFFAVLLFVGGIGFPSAVAQDLPADSAEGDTSHVEWRSSLPPLTVTASRLPIASDQAPARITVLDSAALQSTGASSVASLLEARADFHVRRYGNTGLSTPGLRGTDASQTTLLLDGQRLTDPQRGHLDLSLLPTILLHSVEVMHGPASPVHGSSGLGGAIHLRSLQPRTSPQVRASAHTGAFGQRGGSLLLGGTPLPQTSVLAVADYQTKEGDFPYRNPSPLSSESIRRRNNDKVRQTVYGTVRSQMAAHQVQVSGWWTHAERGLPGPGGSSSQERQWDNLLRLWAQDRVSVEEGVFTVKGKAQHNRLRYRNPSQNLDQTGHTWNTSLESTLQRPLSTHWTMVGGLSGSYAQARHPSLNDTAHQEQLAAFAEGTGSYGRLRLYPALRADTYLMSPGDTRLALSPRLGLNLQPLSAWPDLHVKAQVARAFRVPTFNDRYWQPGGNPDLRPERSWGGDVGVRLEPSRGHAEVTLFGHWRRNQIVWEPTGEGYWAPHNVGRVRALGGEASAGWTWPLTAESHLQTGLSYTVTDARNRSDPSSASYNEPIRYVPRDQLKSHATLAAGPAALDLNARYTGRRPITSDGSRFLDAYVLVDAQLRLEHDFGTVRTELSLQVDNVFDVDYQTIGNRPMPPRHARVRLLVAL